MYLERIGFFLVCAFPYVIAFTSDAMEIRLIVNGNLVHTMTMPKLNLISSKNDIYFATTSPEFFPNKTDRLISEHGDQRTDNCPSPSTLSTATIANPSPPTSPHGKCGF